MIPISRKTIKQINIFSLFSRLRGKIGFELNASLFGKNRGRFTKFNFLNFHQKFDWTATNATRKTFGNIFGWRNDKRWRFFVMKRTKRLIIHASFFCLDISIHNIQNRDSGLNFLGKRHAKNYFLYYKK